VSEKTNGVPGPAPRSKTYHMAGAMRDDGAVSALCYERPRPISLRRASWVMRAEDVTCPKCLRVLASRGLA
jgi:hypothetical protein